MQNWFLKQWQGFGIAQLFLLPISWIFRLLVGVRRWLYDVGLLSQTKLPVPVVVVGNISVGGTGKTPLVMYLVEQLQQAGYYPGVVSRGYGGTQSGEVRADSQPKAYGDEPVLIAKRTGVPVWVNADRVKAGQDLLAYHPQCNVIVSDDGLQHYALKRDVEIVVLNAKHALGNQQSLPAGPLRESVKRLTTADAIVNTAREPLASNINVTPLPPVFQMQIQMQGIISLDEQRKLQLAALQKREVVAIAGIGHPERFFNFLKGLGLQCEYVAFKDHHAFSEQDFAKYADKTILMTEKDAVKCQHLALQDAWYLPVSAMLTSQTQQNLTALIIAQLNAQEKA